MRQGRQASVDTAGHGTRPRFNAPEVSWPNRRARQSLIDLALQGGGSHGAFTWGVLDRLLEEPWLQIDAISGTSAGAMNAAVLADGWTKGGASGARAALDAYWERVARAAMFSPLQRTPLDRAARALDARQLAGLRRPRADGAASFRPTISIPRGYNPLTSILDESIDFERLAQSPIKLFITATNVRTGRGRIFRNAEITPDVLLASACLPTMFQAIEIDGEAYWDGGYAGNPTITPLVRESDAQDTILVQINPRERPGTPRTASEILNRLNEVSFNATLMKELRMIALLRQVADPGTGEGARWAGMRTHRIMTEMMTDLGYSSKLNAERAFLEMLRDEGRRAAERIPRCARRRHRTPLDRRSRRAARGVLSMGLLGILLALALLMWLAYRGWSVLLLAPAAALLAAAISREPLLANWTQTFMSQRRAVLRAVLSAVPARRAVRQAHGRQRLGCRHRQLHDRAPGNTAARSWLSFSPARWSPMAASACSSRSSCWRRWRRPCSRPPTSRAG